MAKRKSWALRIEAAEKRGRFTEQDKDKAQSWNTCAVGERHGWPSGLIFTELRREEINLGGHFLHVVVRDDFAEAKRLYLAIQALP